jgi:hypothetical protein
LTIGHTPKGEEEKNYLTCYQTGERKETSYKEIEWGHPTPDYSARRFFMNPEDGTRLEEFRASIAT